MSDDSNGRIEYIREDFQKLERKMEEGFNKLSEKFDQARKERQAEKQEIYNHCSEKKANINKRIDDNKEDIGELDDKIDDLDKKVNVVAFTGSGIGFILGLLAREFIPRVLTVLTKVVI